MALRLLIQAKKFTTSHLLYWVVGKQGKAAGMNRFRILDLRFTIFGSRSIGIS
jgi:hypothetical protein